MATWRTDPYLWVHLAGLATVPLWLDLALLGLAVGNPALPELELGIILAVGVLPVLAMQLVRPFYIFSVPGLALRPGALQDGQRRLLTQFRSWRVRLGALLVPLPLVWGLLQLYPLAFLTRDLTPFGDWGRPGGVAIALLGFFLANLFLQVPVAVLQVMATPDRSMARVPLYPTEKIAADFMVPGLPLGRLLPQVVEADVVAVSPPPRESVENWIAEAVDNVVIEDIASNHAEENAHGSFTLLSIDDLGDSGSDGSTENESPIVSELQALEDITVPVSDHAHRDDLHTGFTPERDESTQELAEPWADSPAGEITAGGEAFTHPEMMPAEIEAVTSESKLDAVDSAMCDSLPLATIFTPDQAKR